MDDASTVAPLEYRPDEQCRDARRGATLVLGIIIVGQFVLAAISGRWMGLAIPLVCVALYALVRWRTRRLVWRVDEAGIHVPPRFDEPWSAIDSIVRPTPWHDVVTVRLAGSGDERPIGFPIEHAERIAAIGGKPLR